MPQFTVEEDVAALVERLAKPKPFENLSFNSALKRVLHQCANKTNKVNDELDELLAEAMALALAEKNPKKATSPNPEQWAMGVPDLKSKKGLTTWKAICDLLGIDTGGDSARRRLKNWVKANHPDWPQVPEISSD